MTWTLWRWSAKQDEWEFVTQATEDMKRKVKARHARHNPKGTKLKWTEEAKPKRFRTRRKG
jgi:hypothetical protein